MPSARSETKSHFFMRKPPGPQPTHEPLANHVPDGTLTKREIEIVAMMAAGYSNREIAKACFVAEGTVKNHISNILSKLGVRDRTRAVLRALHLGLI
jgi:DNA-binding NarL/FixJ family response regulator